ncbi:MAG: hypothetical protein A2431_02505 [Candidatus Zambryskibacteria bacterium RIFOXYC1_FULL_39_10]|uniref:Uncharacterized protein n=1 Tax=Candidatus Zambryskibacteria bacterium RIFOXYC1_FULL_39_10 TaxID=1802779 RepID=A0A1G2V1T0_9BACT|nr:MAG: hypothetical protein A2431_02505 [Candidatus Zambryskibacteria bacterium RIFOXYC1_FULL_39_10]
MVPNILFIAPECPRGDLTLEPWQVFVGAEIGGSEIGNREVRLEENFGGWLAKVRTIKDLQEKLSDPAGIWGIFTFGFLHEGEFNVDILPMLEDFHRRCPNIPIGCFTSEDTPKGIYRINTPDGYRLFIGHLYF